MPRKSTMRSKEEKLAIVKRNLSGESAMSLSREIGSSDFQIRSWVKIYLAEGEAGLESKILSAKYAVSMVCLAAVTTNG